MLLLFIIAIYVVIGILFWIGKGASMIASYGNLSEKEKSKWNEKAICRVVYIT